MRYVLRDALARASTAGHKGGPSPNSAAHEQTARLQARRPGPRPARPPDRISRPPPCPSQAQLDHAERGDAALPAALGEWAHSALGAGGLADAEMQSRLGAFIDLHMSIKSAS